MTAPLPAPGRERFQPLRSGLVNIYRYDDQEFWFEDGHLLLRGNNGTGKSRVLALQLPFLFDGEVAPHRMEPDSDPAKRVEWNLLMGGRHPDRLGYTWVEFGRRVPEAPGGEEFVTLGCGLSAVAGRGLAGRWVISPEPFRNRIYIEIGEHDDPELAEQLVEGVWRPSRSGTPIEPASHKRTYRQRATSDRACMAGTLQDSLQHHKTKNCPSPPPSRAETAFA